MSSDKKSGNSRFQVIEIRLVRLMSVDSHRVTRVRCGYIITHLTGLRGSTDDVVLQPAIAEVSDFDRSCYNYLWALAV